MPRSQARTQTSLFSSSLASDKTGVAHLPPRTRTQRRLPLRYSLALLLARVQTTWRIWCDAIYSCAGHIRSQSATELQGVSFGRSPVWDETNQTWVPNPDAIARSFYTTMISAIYPWADTQDLRIFLMGFEAGEEWYLHRGNKSNGYHETPSWIPLAEKTFGHVPDRVRQEIMAASGHTSEDTPAAITEVTRSDESTRQKL
jgi:hypothetical protein